MAAEVTLLDAARRGDEIAFEQLVEPHRAELQAHCYRMLASAQDAEDALQEALLGAWRGLPRFEGRSSLRSWLYTVATNACLRLVERRPKLVLPVDYGPAADPHDGLGEPLLEPLWVEPYPDAGVAYEQRESVELAFIAALQHLPARQRAVLILSDVLGFSGAEIAHALDTSPASVYSALQRAHKTVDERLPSESQQATLRALGDGGLQELVGAYVAAWERGDVDAVAALLAEDVTLAMPPRPEWYAGRDAVTTFLRSRPLADDVRSRLVPIAANGQAAFAHYIWVAEQGDFIAHGVEVLSLRGGQITGIMAFLEPAAVPRFGLPDRYALLMRR
jgi:RNA polymerase sigma-70 factor, ECF subfamily